MARCCHEHVAGSIADRVAFWGALHQRLGKLSNRFSHETHGKLIGQIHARIPMPTVDEQRQLQKENAEADEQLWSTLHDMNASTAADHKELVATAQQTIADSGQLQRMRQQRLTRPGNGSPRSKEARTCKAGSASR
jgi:hypothetical protein